MDNAGKDVVDQVDDLELVDEFDRITRNPAVMTGRPCIRGMRVTVGMIVGLVGTGHPIEEILDAYPYLEREDILQAIRYAGALASGARIELAAA